MVPACSQEVEDTSGSSEAASTDDGAKFSTLGRRDGACANRAGKGWLDVQKSTYSYRNTFSIHAVFDAACSEVGADAPAVIVPSGGQVKRSTAVLPDGKA